MLTHRTSRPAWYAVAALIVVAASANAATLGVAWDPSVDTAVVGYKVLIGTQSGVYSAVVDAGAQTVQSFTNLTAGTTYYFAVEAYDGVGNLSAPSAEVVGVAPVSSPLTIVCPVPTATSPGGSPVAVSFSATTSGGVAPVTSNCSPASGSVFPVGTTALLCTAHDAVGAAASCATAVVVTTSSTPNAPAPSPVPVDIAGAVSALVAGCPTLTFTLNGRTVNATSATSYSRGSCSSMANGKQVEVRGLVQSNGSIAAQTISIIH